MTWSSQNSGKPENPRTEVHPNRSMETENLMGRMIKIVQDDISSLFAEHPLTFLNERDFVSEFHMGDLSGCLQRSRAVLAHPPRCRDGGSFGFGLARIFNSRSTGLEGTLGWTEKLGFESSLRGTLMAGTNQRKTTGVAQGLDEPRTQAARRPSHDEIAKRAFEIYLSRGEWPGRDVEDWLEAERQLRNR